MIVDFAVGDDRVATVGREDRLMPALDVDDAETAHPEAEIAVGKIAFVVRPALPQPVALGGDRVQRDRAALAPVPARNAAHGAHLSTREEVARLYGATARRFPQASQHVRN
jgi:hypothetical protein